MATIDNIPEDVFLTETHEYARIIEDEMVRVGISDYAADQLGDVVFVELPEVGDSIEKGESFGTIESVKASSELYSPVSGEITAINNLLEEEPDSVNDNPYDGGWMVEITLNDKSEIDALMNAKDYLAFLKENAS